VSGATTVLQPGQPRGDHIWWISDIRRFQAHYPAWLMCYDIDAILCKNFDAVSDRTLQSQVA
jgi:hypothetical protein